jgi:hypothetical protein
MNEEHRRYREKSVLGFFHPSSFPSFLRVAQMETRASDYESEGREFESLHGGQYLCDSDWRK